ncbi:hypothetical protein [Candidatus Ichthyocystis hellenicum]|uniref:hypothetical protein n=1 Tax=Candidatus Ichthyocystis hellenicum TaxID=1561003 RepID=UPI000B84F146|nr:hypothetical protein [Candidatus Ichthyocystis hellenicum]
MATFIDRKISKVVFSYAQEKIESIIRAGSKYCSEIEEIICKKTEELTLNESNTSELVDLISNEISTCCKEQYIENKLKYYFDTEIMPFILFIDI